MNFFTIHSLVVKMGEECFHAKDYAKALRYVLMLSLSRFADVQCIFMYDASLCVLGDFLRRAFKFANFLYLNANCEA